MADYPQRELFTPADFDVFPLGFWDSKPQRIIGFLGASNVSNYFRMRAIADPGPGYVVWTVTDEPDTTGSHAPEPVQAATIVIASKWSE